MKSEIISAADFLVDLVRLNGSGGPLSEKQLLIFKQNVYKCLSLHYTDHWFPETPDKGSGYRCIRINGKMDPLLARAGALMGIATAALRKLFPQELTMWVDPKEVSYRIGENGSICSLAGPKGSTESADSKEEANKKTVGVKVYVPVRQPSSPVNVQPAKLQSFSPSKSPSPSSPVHMRHINQYPSPPASPPSIREQQLSLQQQQLLFIMNSHGSSTNCKDVLRPALDSNRGMERLFVSS